MPKPPGNSADAVKRLREELGLTQVQLAAEMQLAPSSIHRYEAGTSEPEPSVLHKLYNLAYRKKIDWATEFFRRSIVGPDIEIEWRMAGSREKEDLEGHLILDSGHVIPLTQHEQNVLEALLRMLRSGQDETAKRVLTALLQPWLLSRTAAERDTDKAGRKRRSNKR